MSVDSIARGMAAKAETDAQEALAGAGATFGAGIVDAVAKDENTAGGLPVLDAGAKLLAAALPNPSVSTLGGIKSKAAEAHKFLTAIGTDGLPVAAQPVAADISGSALGGVSPLALGVGAGSIAAQNQALLKQASMLPAPTIYYDPTATGGNGSGSSAANACYTVAQLQSATSGDMSGQVIGFAYGTTTTAEVPLTLGASDLSRPCIILPYNNGNNSTALPTIDRGAVLSSGWSVYSGAIYQNTIGGTVLKPMWQTMPDGTQQRIAMVYASSQGAMLSQLATAAAASPNGGYGCFYGGVLYCVPYNNVNPSTGVIVVPASATPTLGSGGGGLVINYKNQAASGNIIVYGIAVRHTFGSGLLVSVGSSSGSITSLGPVSVVGCDVRHCGRDGDILVWYGSTVCPTGGGDDAIIVYGKNNTVRTSVRIANNFTQDCGNNGVELGFVSGGYNEFNTHVDIGSHAISEHWASVSNVVTRYNYAIWIQGQIYPNYNGTQAAYYGRIILQTALDQTNYQNGGAETPTTAAQSGNNTWIGNVVVNCPSGSGGDGTAIVDNGVSGLVFKYNTFVINSPGNNLCQPLIFGSDLSGSWTTPPAIGVNWSNNIFVNISTYSNCRMLWISPNYNTGYTCSGDGNTWYSNASAYLSIFKINGTEYSGATGPLALANWAGITGMDAHSQWINPGLDANGQPYPFSPGIRCGAYASFLNFNEGSPLFDTIAASSISGLAASATTDTTNATNIASGTLAAARLPNPAASALGGVQSATASSNQFMTGINTSGVPQFAQPSASNISGLGSLATLNSLASSNLSDQTAAGVAMFTAASAAAQTALLNAMAGDSGSGGAKGLVPAPASGTAAAGKFLKADGTWAVPSGGPLTSPIAIGSGTLLSTPVAGDLEYDGQAPYFSPVASVRGIVPAYQYSKVTASGGVSLANNTSAQSFLPSGAQNFPVQSGVIYRLRGRISLSLGTNSKIISMLLATAGGAAFSWISYDSKYYSGSAGGGGYVYLYYCSSASESQLTGTTASSNDYIYVDGEFVMSSAGTIQPQIQFSAAPGGTNTCLQGSYFELYTYGANAASAGLS